VTDDIKRSRDRLRSAVTWPFDSPGESRSRDGKRHVMENVTWPWRVEVVTPLCWGPLPTIWLEIHV